MKKALFAAILTVSSSVAALAYADDAPAPAPTTSAAATPLQVRPSKPLTLAPAKDERTPLGYKLLAGGVVVVAAGIWLKKKQGLSLSKGGKKKRSPIDVLGRTSLGVRNELLVVEAEGTRLLIGMTPGSMQTLAVLQTPEGVIGEESPELPGEAKYADPAPSAPVMKARTLREQLDEDDHDEDEAEAEVEQLSHRVRSLLDARKKKAPAVPSEPAPPAMRRAVRTQPLPKASVPGQAKGLLLSMDEARNDDKITKLGDW